jgi:predicted transcriptional regulator
MQPQILHTEYPTEPPEGFNEWFQYIATIQEEIEPLQRYKREIEVSFNQLHESITTQGIPER